MIKFFQCILFLFFWGNSAQGQGWDQSFAALQQAYNAANYTKANSLFSEALNQAVETYGEKHEAYVYTLHYGVLLAFQNQDFEKGLEMAEDQIELIKSVEVDNQFYANVLNNTSQIHLQLGNLEKAIIFSNDYIQLLKDSEKNTLKYGLALFDYASLLYQQQNKAAYDNFKAALPILSSHIEQAGNQYLNTLFYIASLSFEQQKLDESAKFFDKVLGITEDNNLQNSSIWKNSAYQRALIYQDRNKNKEAIALYERLQEQLEIEEEITTDLYNSTQNNLGILYQKTGQKSKGEKLLASEGTDIKSRLNQAALAFNNGEYANALALYNLANDSLAIDNRADSLTSVRISAQKALVLNQMDNADSALLLLKSIESNILNYLPGKHEEKALAYKNTGDIYLANAGYDSAYLYLEKALVQFEGKNNFPAELKINIINSLGVLAQNKVELEKAKSYFVDNLSLIASTLGNRTAEYANALNNLGYLSLEKGDYIKAEEYFINAGEIYAEIYAPSHELNSGFYENLGILAKSRSRYKKADSLFQLAEEAYLVSKGPDHAILLNVYNKRALIQLSLANYPLSEQYFRKALLLSGKIYGKNNPAYADALSGISLFYQTTGNLTEAEQYLLPAIEIYKQRYGEIHPSYVTAIENLSSIYQRSGRQNLALPLLQKALTSDSILYGTEHPKYAATLHNLASLYLNKEDFEKAEQLYLKSLLIDEKVFGEETPAYASTQYNLAVLYQQTAHIKKADSLFSKVLTLRKEILGESHPDYVFTLYGWGLLKQTQNENELAYQYLQKAVDSYLFLFKEYFPSMSESEKAAFYAKVNPVFEAYKDFALENIDQIPGLKAELFNLQLNTKAMLLNASTKMRSKIINSGNKVLINEFNEWQSLKESAIQFYSYTLEELEAQNIDLGAIEAEINTLEKELSIKSDLFNAGFSADSINWQSVRANLASNTAVVEIIRVKKSLKNDSVIYAGLIVTDQSTEPEVVILQAGRQIEKKFFNAYQNLIKYKLPDKISYENLWEWVDVGIPEGLDKLYISPDGIYNKININTLYSEEKGEYLLEKENIRIITSARDLIKYNLPNDLLPTENGLPDLVLLGAPDFSMQKSVNITFNSANIGLMHMFEGEIPPLPGTKVEIEAISALTTKKNWRVKQFTGINATEMVIDSLNSPTILHIATHGFFKAFDEDESLKGVDLENRKNSNPLLRSGLLLAGASIGLSGELPYENSLEDGLLTAYETMSLNLDNTELVILSACETGLGEVKNGEGVYGLQRAFQIAGAKNIIMSLWTVNDYTTQLLMTEFYKNWTEGKGKFEAFRLAQMKIKEDFPEPYYWAAFTIIGE